MMNNQRGGILSKIFIIPVGVAFMVGFFFLGYYVGKYQSKTGKQDEIIPPLPEVVSNNLPKREEFTFYKTLTDKENKTVSIDLKPKQADDESRAEKKPADAVQGHDKSEQSRKDKKTEPKAEKPRTIAKEPELKPQTSKKEPAVTSIPDPKIRYTLQIASYQEKQPAEEDVKKLKQRGYAAFIVSTELQGKGTWHRVRLGSFSNKTSAEKLQRELRTKEGITPFITIE